MSSTFFGTDMPSDYVPDSDEKNIALLSHILTFIAPVLAPLIIYVIKKDESPFIAYHAKESLNFQITLMIVVIALAITVIGVLLIFPVGIFALIVVIIATIRASEGRLYRYPMTIRFIK